MRNKDSERALAEVNPPKNGQLPPVVSFVLITAVILLSFLSGVFLCPPLRQWWREAKTLSAMPSQEDRAKLFAKVAAYTKFWMDREPRLEKARERFGWSQKDFDKATRLIEAAKSRFEAVEIGYLAWDQPDKVSYQLLKKEVDALYEQLALTFCEEFGLKCLRGVPPDQAHFKSRAKPQALQRTGGLYYFIWRKPNKSFTITKYGPPERQ